MPPRKGKKRATKSKTRKSAAKTKRASARVLGGGTPPTITIYPDGTYTPTGGVQINPGGVVKFDITYPTGANTCYVTFGEITFGEEPLAVRAAVGTIKVGSGN